MLLRAKSFARSLSHTYTHTHTHTHTHTNTHTHTHTFSLNLPPSLYQAHNLHLVGGVLIIDSADESREMLIHAPLLVLSLVA